VQVLWCVSAFEKRFFLSFSPKTFDL